MGELGGEMRYTDQSDQCSDRKSLAHPLPPRTLAKDLARTIMPPPSNVVSSGEARRVFSNVRDLPFLGLFLYLLRGQFTSPDCIPSPGNTPHGM
jgi:hypothetical protein